MAEIEDLVRAVRALLATEPGAEPFLADWPEARVSRAQAARQLPVGEWLGDLAPLSIPRTAPVVAGVVAEAGRLDWRQTYAPEDFGARFLERYGWSEFIGERGPIASDRIACGVLLLGPDLDYPPHAHAAAELYLPLAGTALWRQAAADFAPVRPGEAIHHAPWVPHATRTGAEPLLALYLWRGGDLSAKSVVLGDRH